MIKQVSALDSRKGYNNLKMLDLKLAFLYNMNSWLYSRVNTEQLVIVG